MASPVKTKTYSFFEETLKCKVHREIANYFCICKQKLCFRCVSEGIHLNQHSNVLIMPTKELRKEYINEVDELEGYLNEMNEKRVKAEEDHSPFSKSNGEKYDMTELKHFSQNFFMFIKKFYIKLLRDMFADEKVVYNEIKAHMEVINKNSQFKCEEILDFVTKSKVLKEKARESLIAKYEKINEIQGVLVNKSEEIENELRSVFEKYFFVNCSSFQEKENNFNIFSSGQKKLLSNEKDFSYAEDGNENSFVKLLNSNLNKIINDSDYPSELSKFNNVNCLNTCSNEIKDLIKSRNSKAPTGDNKKSNKTKQQKKNQKNISPWNDEMVIQLSQDGSVSYEKDCDFETENENLERGSSQANEMEGDSDPRDLSYQSYEKKSVFTEFISANENRSRMQNFMKKKNKNQTSNSNFPSQKTTYNNFGLTKNYNLRVENSNANANLETPTFYNNNLNPTFMKNRNAENPTKMCVDCLLPYTPSKSNPVWKKRCLECQKNYCNSPFKKTNNENSASTTTNQFSYKSGKINQTCLACKKSFVVPLALSKQRKTCYHCFKANKK